MATKTSLLGLTKPAYTEAADIAVLNDNFDLIDKAVGQGKFVRNELDNSWFADPIAQAGRNGFHGSTKYPCDRWISEDADTTFDDGSITPGSPIDQYLDLNRISLTATYTAAICLADGTIRTASGNFSSGFGSSSLGIYCPAATTRPYVRLSSGISIKWAALYEGAYTAETLPAYVYKGYAAELAECQRYYIGTAKANANNSWQGYAHGTTEARIVIPTGVQMRSTPTLAVGSLENLTLYPGPGHPTEIIATELAVNAVTVRFTAAGLTNQTPIAVKVNTTWGLSADL